MKDSNRQFLGTICMIIGFVLISTVWCKSCNNCQINIDNKKVIDYDKNDYLRK